MSTCDIAAAKPKKAGPISQVLNLIRGRLTIAAVLASVTEMLAQLRGPHTLAVIARAASIGERA